jgi:hypothetical protein
VALSSRQVLKPFVFNWQALVIENKLVSEQHIQVEDGSTAYRYP